MNIVDIMKSALERIAGIEMFHSLDVSMWNNLPLFSKICFVAAGPLLCAAHPVLEANRICSIASCGPSLELSKDARERGGQTWIR